MRLGPMARVQGAVLLLRYVIRARQLSLASVLIAAALRLACQLITRNQRRQWRRRRRHRAPALNGVRSEGTPVVRPNALAVGVVWVPVEVSSAVTPGDLAAAAPIAPRQWLQAPNAVTEGRVGLRRLRCRSSGHGREQHETKRPQHPGARSGPARRAPHKAAGFVLLMRDTLRLRSELQWLSRSSHGPSPPRVARGENLGLERSRSHFPRENNV